MLSFSTILIYYSQEARPYSIFFFFLMVLLTIFFWILESSGEKNRRWFLFIFITGLILITRGMVPVTALIALNFAFILSVLVSFVEEKKFVYPFSPIVLRNFVLSTAIAGLFYVPFFLKIWANSHHYVDESLGIGGKAWSLFEPFQLVVTSRLPYNLENNIFFCLVGFILGAFFIIRNRLKKPSQFVFFLYAVLEPLVSVYLYYIVIDTTVLKPKSK